jgi:hypothetical protein
MAKQPRERVDCFVGDAVETFHQPIASDDATRIKNPQLFRLSGITKRRKIRAHWQRWAEIRTSQETTRETPVDNTDPIIEPSATASEDPSNLKDAAKPKKKFVTPEITVPVDVLDATTFFQAVDSGVTN